MIGFTFPLGSIYSTPGGAIYSTPGVIRSIPAKEIVDALMRHASGDWGDLDPEDKQANDDALAYGGRLFSAYTSSDGIRFWIITEADRSMTDGFATGRVLERMVCMGFVLVDRRTGDVIERHEYDFNEFIKNKYSRFCSLQLGDRLIIGDVHPELVWQETKEKGEGLSSPFFA